MLIHATTHSRDRKTCNLVGSKYILHKPDSKMSKMKLKFKSRNLSFVLIFYLFTSSVLNSQGFANRSSIHKFNESYRLSKIDSVIDFGKTLLGKPYRHVVKSGEILDCSGFINHIYKKFKISLPRTSSLIAKTSKKISFSEIKKGDLMFFKGRNIRSNSVGHISIVTSVDGDIIEMMHSCNRGVIIEKYNSNKYYTSRYLYAGRLEDFSSSESNKSSSLNDSKLILNDTTNKVKIIGVGDIMLGTNFPNDTYLPPNDGKYILKPVEDIIKKGTISFGNLEGVLLTGNGTVKQCSNPKVCYAFKMPNHYVNYLVESGFNLLSIANNHIRDFGNEGTSNTIEILKKAGIFYAGLEECKFTTFEKNGIKYGFAAFAPNTGTVRINNYPEAKKIISYLNEISDIVIVSFHGGAEGPTKKNITRKTEIFLGENRGNPYEFSRMAIDAGADVVFGHGPHVTRAVDIYKDRFIAYSLGNFVTYGRFNLSGPNGISPIIELDLDINGKFISGKIHSTKQLGKGGPVIDNENQALNEIIKLTKTDIPESKLIINLDGTITKT